MTIKTDSWHYRWYAYWLERGRGNKPHYQENLCHYVRVLLFWAPMTWLDQTYDAAARSKRVGVALVLLIGAAYVGLIGLLLTLLGIDYPVQFLMALGSLAGLIVTLAMLYYLGRFILTHRLPRPPTFGIPTTTRLIAACAVAKKHRICPFITFEGE